MKDSPFHTSATLNQRVRESISSRQPPLRNNEERVHHKPQKRHQYVPQNIIKQSRNPLFSRPSLQFIPRQYQCQPLLSFQSCRDIEGSAGEHCNNERNPFKQPAPKYQVERRLSMGIMTQIVDREPQHVLEYEKRKRLIPEKDSLKSEHKQDDGIFKFQDFQDQLNQILRDQRNARQLLDLIQKNEFGLDQPSQQEPRIEQRMFVNFESDLQQKLEEEIDFDALREQQLAVVYPNKLSLAESRLPIISELENKNNIEIKQRPEGEARMFLLFEGEVGMKKYDLN